MQIFPKTIFTGFAPNLTSQDVRIALSYIFLPWKWKNMNQGKNIERCEREIEKYLGIKHSVTFDSGRSALLFALKASGIKNGDEVLVQAYTCMVVVNSIVQSGAKPIYVDIKNDFNMNADDLEKKISPKSKVLIIQHTFGLSAEMEILLAIAKKNGLTVVEDCAHSFGAKHAGKLLGTFGDVALLSFGADKVVSSARGGALITNNNDLFEKISELRNALPKPKIGKTMQHLAHFPIFSMGKKTYGIYLGKILLALSQKLHLMNKVIYDAEKKGESVDFYPSKFANSLAHILLGQLAQVENTNGHRREMAQYYEDNIKNEKIELPWKKENIKKEDCIYLRYPILSDLHEAIFSSAKRQGVILGNWYDTVIAPADIEMKKTGYKYGSCPNAERLAPGSVNLPTDRNIDIEDAKKIVAIINSI